MALIIKNFVKISLGKQLFKIYSLQAQKLQVQGLKTTGVIFSSQKQNVDKTQNNDSANIKKKRKELLMITLFQNENMSVVSLEDAKNLAKRRSMQLLKVQDMDTKTQRPVYKLLTSAEVLQNELSEIKRSDGGTSKKSEKTLSVSSRIAEHDLASRIKNISKWLSKQHEVRILIQSTSGQDLASSEKIFKVIEEAVKTSQVIGKIVQKRTKGGIIKFSILPVPPATNNSTSNSQ